ncbi:MAG: glycosyltransferase [Microcoleaceae cyanobacterium MO_207.B10]|nr:glycosyltransferase [Microcoleaceae cyanobacterium MO_207.B10]
MVHKLEEFVVCVAHPNKSAYSETFIRAHIEHLPAKVIDLHGVWFPLRYNQSELKQFLLENHVDAVLAEFGPTGVAMMDICQEIGLPLIVHFHGADANRNDIVFGEVGQHYPELFQKAAAIVTPSNFLRERVLKLGASPQKVIVNYNGVDTSLFTEAYPALSPPTFIAVSRFVDVKGPQLSILAFKKVVEACHDARLIMVGDGPLLESCQQLARALEISSSIDFLGVKQHSEIIDIMHSGRAFIQHSIRTSDGQCEALGIVFLEAGASGLPVVGTFSGGIPEVVTDGETGLLVAECDINRMAECMLRLAENPNLAEELGKAASRRVSTNFSMDKSSSGLWKIIKEAINEQKAIDQIININLKEINLILFPDWSQPEEQIFAQLKAGIGAIIQFLQSIPATILIYTNNISDEEANEILSGVAMNLFMEENLEVNEKTEVSLVGNLNKIQWKLLLGRIKYRIALEEEDKKALSYLGAENLPVLEVNKNEMRLQLRFIGSAQYWENRYVYGGNSGVGSYGHIAEFKANIINDFVAQNQVKTVIEFGCGDGNQLIYAQYPQYIGVDVSQKAVEICREKFKNDSSKKFILYEQNCFGNQEKITADLGLSLDVIFHLIEDEIFYLYMNNLFNSAKKFVIIYSSDYEEEKTDAQHVRHRNFSNYISQTFKNWEFVRKIPNQYPVSEYKERGSFCDFYIYQKH